MWPNRRKVLPASWWIRAGERLCLGLDLMEVLGGGKRDCQQRLRQELQAGKPVVEAMRAAGMELPLEAWSLLQAGEHCGRLGEAMREVGELLGERLDRRREWLGQLWYPAMVLLVATGVMGILLVWVIPRLRGMAQAMQTEKGLPWLTEHLGTLYAILLAAGFVPAGLFVALTLFMSKLARKSVRAGRIHEGIQSRIPLWGPLRNRIRCARILKQLGTMLTGGTTLPAALTLVAGSSESQWEKAVLIAFRESLLMGMDFPGALKSCPLIEAGVVPLLEAGQEGGRLDHFMVRSARQLETEARRRIGQWTRFLEPAFLLLLSLLVGGLLLAYLLPMVQLLGEAGGNLL